MNFEIKSIYGNVLFSGDFSSLAKCLESAVNSGANLAGANLTGANLTGANLTGANLTDANLAGAYLAGAKNADYAIARTRILPEGDLIGWKKCKDEAIVKLLIPSDAKRCHAFGRKCRAEFVMVLEVFRDGKPSEEPAIGSYDGVTKYAKGETVRCDRWCDDFTQECAGGIHFFITRLEAENYNL